MQTTEPRTVPTDYQVQHGDYVYFHGSSSNAVVHVTEYGQLKLRHVGKVKATELVGLPYNSFVEYSMNNKIFKKAEKPKSEDIWDDTSNPNTQGEIINETADNRNLIDTSTAQKLDNKIITKRKATDEGVVSMVDELVQNSSTFSSKTKMAQMKYVQKKAERWSQIYQIRRPCLADFCTEYAQRKSPIYLSTDTVQRILDHAHVMFDSRVLIYDESQGILPAAILHRLQSNKSGEAKMYQILSRESTPKTFVAKALGLTSGKNVWKVVSAFAFQGNHCIRHVNSENNTMWSLLGEPGQATDKAMSNLCLQSDVDENDYSQGLPTCLVIASKWDHIDLFDAFFPYLALGGCFCIFSPSITNLEKLFFHVRRCWDSIVFRENARTEMRTRTASHGCDGVPVQCHVMECNVREYQILPSRTHPTVQSNPHSGYLFVGSKVGKI